MMMMTVVEEKMMIALGWETTNWSISTLSSKHQCRVDTAWSGLREGALSLYITFQVNFSFSYYSYFVYDFEAFLVDFHRISLA